MPVNELFLISTRAGAGGHYFVLEDIRWLIKKGFTVHLVSEAVSPPFEGIKLHTLRRLRLPNPSYLRKVVRWISRWKDVFKAYHVSCLASQIKEILDLVDVPFVHAHFAYPEGVASVLATNLPVLVTVHGCDALIHRSTGYGIRLSEFGDRAVRWALKNASLVMVANEFMKSSVKELAEGQKIEIVTNAVDVGKFSPDVECRFNPPPTYIFCLKQHVPVSGIDVLIKAFKKVSKKYPNLKLLIGGRGPLTEYYSKLVRELDLERKVSFLGYIRDEDLPCYYSRALMVVVPSFCEAFGLSATEGMASGRPVVASDVGGLREQVIHGYNGLRFPPGDHEALAEAIEALLGDPDEAERMGRMGRKLAVEKYSMEKRIKRLIEIYKRYY